MKKITNKTIYFTDQLKSLPLNREVIIPNREYKPSYVRIAVTNLRKEGFDFICTEKGCIDCVKVTRTR